MKISPVALIALIALISSINPAQAEFGSPKWEVIGGTTAAFDLFRFDDGNPSSMANETTWSSYGGINYFLEPQLEVGTYFSFKRFDSAEKETYSGQLTVGPTFNFSDDAKNAFFVTGQAGVLHTSPTDRVYTVIAYYIGVGKRIALAEHVSWAPQVNYTGWTEGSDGDYVLGASNLLSVIPVQISVVF